MRYSITISEAAETDIRNVFLWYGKQQKNLDNTFERIISKAIESIQENPLKTQIRYKKQASFFLVNSHMAFILTLQKVIF